MASMDFTKRQPLDMLEWAAENNRTLTWLCPWRAWKFNTVPSWWCASLMAVFVNEGQWPTCPAPAPTG